MTGGPISDRRIIAGGDDQVTFWARSRDQRNKSRPLTLAGWEFVRRWAMHILPKGYTRTRTYGGYHTTKRDDYSQRCRALLPATDDAAPGEDRDDLQMEASDRDDRDLKCPRCNVEMTLIADPPRPRWTVVFARDIYLDASLYCPLLHLSRPGLGVNRGPPREASRR